MGVVVVCQAYNLYNEEQYPKTGLGTQLPTRVESLEPEDVQDDDATEQK